jgi:hypothetical protein
MQMNALLKKDVKPISIALAKGRKAVRSRGSYKLSDKFFSSSRAEMGRLFSNRLELFVTFWFKPKSKAKPITYPNIGIQVANCPNNRITENSIDGQYNANMLTKGIYISNSPNSSPNCNVTSKTGRGIEFYLDEQGAAITYNLFQNCQDGFVLNNGLTPDQGSPTICNFNKWTNSTVTALHHLYEPVHNALQINAVNFYVPSFGIIHTPTLISGGFNIPPPINPFNTDACSNIGGGGEDDFSMTEQILNGEWAIEGFENSTDEIARIHFFSFLTATNEDLNNEQNLIVKRDELLTLPNLQQFIIDFENSDLGDLAQVRDLINAGQLPQALIANAGLNNADDYIAGAREYNNLYLQYLNDETILNDEAFQQQVLAMATSCPLQYGNTVYQAQAMYQLIDPWAVFQDDDLCDVPAARKANPTKAIINSKKQFNRINKNTNKLSVSPNPSNGKFRLNCSEINGLARIELVNNIGEIVYKNATANFVNGNFELNLISIGSGLYYVKVIANNTNYSVTSMVSKE